MLWFAARAVAARRDEIIRVERVFELPDQLPVRMLGVGEPLHGLDARAVGHAADALSSLEQRVIAGMRALGGGRIGALEQQRDRAVEATIRQAGQGNQRLDAMLTANLIDHVYIVQYLGRLHRHQRRVPDQAATIGIGIHALPAIGLGPDAGLPVGERQGNLAWSAGDEL